MGMIFNTILFDKMRKLIKESTKIMNDIINKKDE